MTLRRLEDTLGARDTARDTISFTAPPEAANVFLVALEAARLHLEAEKQTKQSATDHAGTMRCSGRAPDGLVFELGLRAAGPPLLWARAGDVLLSA